MVCVCVCRCRHQLTLWLCADPLGVTEEVLQRVYLRNSDSEHDKQVEAGPEGHSPQVVLQKVAVPGLEGPQHGLRLTTPLKVLVHGVHPCLEEDEEIVRQLYLRPWEYVRQLFVSLSLTQTSSSLYPTRLSAVATSAHSSRPLLALL